MSTEEIILAVQAFGTFIVAIFVIYQSRILHTQINTQNSIMQNMKTFTEIIDVAKIKEYAKLVEETIIHRTEKEKREFEEKFKLEIEELKKDKEAMETFSVEPAEVLMDIITKLFDKGEDRREFIEKRLPKSGHVFKNYLDEYEKTEPDKPKSAIRKWDDD